MTKDIMIDIETLGVDKDAVILSIGACDVWNPSDSFYREIDIESQPTRKIDPNTLKFWIKEGNIPIAGEKSLSLVLLELYDWIVRVANKEELHVWCKGTDFDTVILSHAYKFLGQAVPWKYNSPRDFRTLMKHFSKISAPEFIGKKHNALHDAIHQAAHLRLILA